jgi:dienelactone hydrolase
VSSRAFLCIVLAIFSVRGVARQNLSPNPARERLKAGTVIPKVICSTQPDQSYVLYVPSYYSPNKRWPIVYAFDPLARGDAPVESMKDAAERYGYIVAGSDNAHNGPSQPLTEAAQAVFRDTHARLAIDNRRIYFAGFSGTARFAASLEQACKCAAGVLLAGAGFATSSPPAPGAAFPVFLAVGTLDFNYGEVVDLDAKLGALHYPHALRRFEGPHEWAPTSVMEEAFAWFRLIAMKDGREELDMEYVKKQAVEAEQRAEALALSGDAYGSWEEYRQDADTFEGLLDVASSFRERAAALEKKKAVRDGAKLEGEEIEEQSRLTAEIASRMEDLRQSSANRTLLRDEIAGRISDLRSRAGREKNSRKLLVDRRALAGVFMQAIETGQALLQANRFSVARLYFGFAASAEPDSAAALQELAIARALDGDRKGAIEALSAAAKKSTDTAGFSTWLAKEPAFANLRDDPHFRALLVPAKNTR